MKVSKIWCCSVYGTRGKSGGWLLKKRVYVFDVFNVFECLRFSFKKDFMSNVSDVFDVFDVFRYFTKKI